MSLSRLTTLSIIGVFALACDSADDITGPPATGMGYAAARLECVGPLSETGVAIFLSTRPIQPHRIFAPWVRIVIRRSLEDLAERAWAVAGSGAEASAWYHLLDHAEIATSGEVTVNAVESDKTIDGWADLTFPGFGRVGGNFRAYWISGNPACI
jgi:hypothetical protein